MSRKATLSIGALLIAIDLGVTAAILESGERRLAVPIAAAAAIIDRARNFANPIPRL